jgi:hypothetical protein
LRMFFINIYTKNKVKKKVRLLLLLMARFIQ